MVIKKLIVSLTLVLVLTGCQFSEDCRYTGNVLVLADWDNLWDTLEKPESLEVFFYGKSLDPKAFFGDTLYSGISSGNSNILIYNPHEDIIIKGKETLATAEIHLPTYFNGNTRAVKESPLICTSYEQALIPIEDVVTVRTSPRPIVKQMDFTINIVSQGQIGEILSCDAMLSGMTTGYSLMTNQPHSNNRASVFFPLQKIDSAQFRHDFFVLGVAPSAQNILTITVKLSDGEVKTSAIDLSTELNSFTDDIFSCCIDVNITAASIEVTISQWEQGIFGQLIIQ